MVLNVAKSVKVKVVEEGGFDDPAAGVVIDQAEGVERFADINSLGFQFVNKIFGAEQGRLAAQGEDGDFAGLGDSLE